MNRFLNGNSRIHYQTVRRKSIIQPSYSFLGYICRRVYYKKQNPRKKTSFCILFSIADDDKHIEQILLIFGEKYRSLIQTIIEEDCHKRYKRTIKNIHIPSSLLSKLQSMNDKS